MYPLDDTIAAIASPPGGAARGIIRISGPAAVECLGPVFLPGPLAGEKIEMRMPCIVPGSVQLPGLHGPLPCEVYHWSHRSYTGQPIVEIHTLGSSPLLDMLLQAICAAGARLAGPGEFTLRAFLSGRIDLTQAEAVLGVIDADDSRHLQTALEQLAGGLARPLHHLRNTLLDLLADIEAGLDFTDEDILFVTGDEIDRRLSEAERSVTAMLARMASRAEAAEDARVVLVGRPNAGKSSLFNVLAGQHAALVSDRPGTTRDYLTVNLDLDGVQCTLIDTAGTGVKPADGEQESLRLQKAGCAVDRTAEAVSVDQRGRAHVELLCVDSTRASDALERQECELTHLSHRIVVLTKCDAIRGNSGIGNAIETSSRDGRGLDILRRRLRECVMAVRSTGGDVVACTALRCADSLRLAGDSLDRAKSLVATGREELLAAEIRTALDELGKVAGAVYTEDVLDRIFSRFCVGK